MLVVVTRQRFQIMVFFERIFVLRIEVGGHVGRFPIYIIDIIGRSAHVSYRPGFNAVRNGYGFGSVIVVGVLNRKITFDSEFVFKKLSCKPRRISENLFIVVYSVFAVVKISNAIRSRKSKCPVGIQ